TGPSKFSGGVPVNVRVPASKDNHVGNGSPLASDAVRVSASPSTSAKVFAGIWNVEWALRIQLWLSMIFATVGASFTALTSMVMVLGVGSRSTPPLAAPP